MPYRNIKWATRTAQVVNHLGEVLWSKEVEVPENMSENAVNVVADKYLCNRAREPRSLRAMIDSVSDTIAKNGMDQGYFDSSKEAKKFADWLKWIQVSGVAGFNSPVYFNVGQQDEPQVSACFINGMEDHMSSITDLASREAEIFKNGSGSGVDYSVLRSSKEPVGQGGNASGPVSFLKAHDTLAGEIRSGGVVRRSAKMAVLDVSHPDIKEFIGIKDHEEKKIRALAAAGIEPYIADRLEDEVSFQNTNLSVRMDRGFLSAVERGESWQLIAKDGSVIEEVDAQSLMDMIADHAWSSAEPGVHFSDRINEWNTVSHIARIEASNPCSEFMFVNDSACNLAAVNLVRLFYKQPENPWGLSGKDLVRKVIHTMIWAQDILVDMAKYPNAKIEKNSHSARPLGLGFTDLGSLLMLNGAGYDTPEGRRLASECMNTISSEAHLASCDLADKLGAYEWFDEDTHLSVIEKHRAAATGAGLPDDNWAEVLQRGQLRNAQLTLLAPCGTMGFLLDNVTTGIEPIFSHVSYKNLVGGGQLKLVNRYLDEALHNLGYDAANISETGDLDFTIKEEHIPVFMTAGQISWRGHLAMMAAVQPFLSGSISKTVNMPSDSSPEDIKECYFQAWKWGLKSVIVYRDGSKSGQVLSSSSAREEKVSRCCEREKMPDDRLGGTHKFTIGGQVKAYLNWSAYEDGRLGEIFVKIAKEGSTLSGLMDALATVVSVALQYGVPLEDLVDKMTHRRFEPSGMTSNPDIRFADSLIDYIFRYLGLKFLGDDNLAELGLAKTGETVKGAVEQIGVGICPKCGNPLRRLGSCEHCSNCGFNGGSCS